MKVSSCLEHVDYSVMLSTEESPSDIIFSFVRFSYRLDSVTFHIFLLTELPTKKKTM